MKKIYYLVALALMVSLWSCSDDYLERMPGTAVGESQDFFNAESGLQTYSNGFYNYVDYSSAILDDFNSDNCDNSTTPTTIRLANYVLPTSLGSGGWNWAELRDVNYFLDRCYASTLSSSAKNQYIGIAKLFRAMFYFEKVKAFGDVPWYSHALGSTDEAELYKARDSRVLVMDSVLNDLNEAIEYLPATKYKNKVSKYTALAMKSRICLFEGTWRKYHKTANLANAEKFLTEAASAAGELIKDGVYTLYSTGNTTSDFRNLFQASSVSTDEVIWAYSFATGRYHHYSAYYTVASFSTNGATRSLISDFGMNDGRSFYDAYPNETVRDEMPYKQEMENRDPRLKQCIVYPGYTRIGTTNVSSCCNFTQTRLGYQITKRVGGPSEDDQGDNRDVILIRYAEVLLNYAEAKAELGTLTQSDLDMTINKIRARAGLPARTLPLTTDIAQKKMYLNVSDPNILEVRRERRVELAFEGFRRWDIIRWAEGHLFRNMYEGIYVEALNTPIDLNGDGKPDVYFYKGETPSTKIENVQYISFQSQNGLSGDTKGRFIPYKKELSAFNDWEYLSPIPSEELTLNVNLKQNPGWDTYK